MRKAPLSQMKDAFGDKEKLVDAITGLIELGTETKEQAKARLLAVSNAKLLHLHAVAKEVKDKFGSRDKLADAVATKLGRTKDKDYRSKLGALTAARLLDLFRVAERKARATAAKTSAGAKQVAKKAAAAPAAAAKKAVAAAKPKAKAKAKAKPKAKA